MRETLADKIVEAECPTYKPFSMKEKLNTMQKTQAKMFKPGSKLNKYYSEVSGSRPQSMLAQAASVSGLQRTKVVKAIALELDEHPEKVDIAVREGMLLQMEVNEIRQEGMERGLSEFQIQQEIQAHLNDALGIEYSGLDSKDMGNEYFSYSLGAIGALGVTAYMLHNVKNFMNEYNDVSDFGGDSATKEYAKSFINMKREELEEQAELMRNLGNRDQDIGQFTSPFSTQLLNNALMAEHSAHDVTRAQRDELQTNLQAALGQIDMMTAEADPNQYEKTDRNFSRLKNMLKRESLHQRRKNDRLAPVIDIKKSRVRPEYQRLADSSGPEPEDATRKSNVPAWHPSNYERRGGGL